MISVVRSSSRLIVQSNLFLVQVKLFPKDRGQTKNANIDSLVYLL
jgi:hypothetical protein